MRLFFLFLSIFITSLLGEELKVTANSFEADEKRGISIFSGDVTITKGTDVMRASQVTIHIDENRHPITYIADGNVSFFITTEDNSSYEGKAHNAIFSPDKQEYKFSGDVELNQLNEKKKIVGNEVIVNMLKGTAVAQGMKNRPVIMIFELEDKND
ncbi:MAG: lipopolysaccharide transport periplasmic protein LptA [Campylobacterota bacterium]|nr:lipopolysaccharide transport periplasmic protein LptA [Campylobacterota bacterium]